MNEFQERYAKLSRAQRMKVRRDMEAEALKLLSIGLKMRATTAQLRAAAKKKVDIAIGRLRKAV